MLPSVNMVWMAILWSVGLAVFCISLWMLFALFGAPSHTKNPTNDSTEKILKHRLTAGEIDADEYEHRSVALSKTKRAA